MTKHDWSINNWSNDWLSDQLIDIMCSSNLIDSLLFGVWWTFLWSVQMCNAHGPISDGCNNVPNIMHNFATNKIVSFNCDIYICVDLMFPVCRCQQKVCLKYWLSQCFNYIGQSALRPHRNGCFGGGESRACFRSPGL